MDEQTARPPQDRPMTADGADRPKNAPDSASPPPKKKRGRIALIVGVSAAAILAVAFLRPHSSGNHQGSRHRGASTGTAAGSATANQPEPVGVTTVRGGDMPVVLTLLGTVVPITNVTLQARVSGHLMKVEFTEGQHVNAGDELELIDPRPYQAALDQWKGTLGADRANLDKARIDNRRYQTLIKQQSTSAMTAVDQEYTVKQLEGTVAYDEAQVYNAELNLHYCHIMAPVGGRIGIRGVDMGNYVAAGTTTLGTLTQMQPISVIYTVPQNELARVNDRLREVGQLPVSAWDGANEHQIADGTVKALDSQIDTSTGTIRMRGIFTNEDEHLFPNQFVNAHLLVETLHNVMLVPNNALQTGPDGQFVYVVQADSTVAVQDVKTGISSNDTTVIVSGVKLGDRVVTDGTSHLRPGTKITIPADKPAASTTDATKASSGTP